MLITIISALIVDRIFGEPGILHPLVGFGRLAMRVEKIFYGDSQVSIFSRRLRGLMATAILVIPFTCMAVAISFTQFEPALNLLSLYLAVGWKSLEQHAMQIHRSLSTDKLDAARLQVGLIVSRDTKQLDATRIATATVESILENGSDAVIGAIFWFMIAGAPGVIAYRLINTLDAMWGYRNQRYQNFGRACAGLDDLFNMIPSRITALSYSLCGNSKSAFYCWIHQGYRWKSPNAGVVMASGAASLGIEVGGPAYYQGKLESKPLLGHGRHVASDDIIRAIQLLRRSLVVILIIFGGGALIVGQGI